MNTKLHAITDANGRPLSFFITAGQISDYTGAAALLDDLPKAQWMLADRGYDAEWFRDALEQKGIKPCIPGRKSRSIPVKYDKRRYKRRNRTASRSCSAVSKTGDAWQRDTTAVQPSSSPPSHSPPPCSSGCNQ
jgi:transposase